MFGRKTAISDPSGAFARRRGGQLIQVVSLHGRIKIPVHHAQPANVFVDFDENQQVEFFEVYLVTWPNRLSHDLDD